MFFQVHCYKDQFVQVFEQISHNFPIKQLVLHAPLFIICARDLGLDTEEVYLHNEMYYKHTQEYIVEPHRLKLCGGDLELS